jgi:hypothetical protein
VRSDGWPWGAATSRWPVGEVWPDGHDLTIPPETPPGLYRVQVTFYDPATLEHWEARRASTGELLGDSWVVDVITVGDWPGQPAIPLAQPLELGDTLRLEGATWQRNDAPLQAGDRRPAQEPLAIQGEPGDQFTLQLFWAATQPMAADYTAFVHLVAPGGQVVAQVDHPPLHNFLPTSAWYPGQRVVDRYNLTLPPTLPAGDYVLYTGIYLPADGQRLPIRQNGVPVGDAYPLAHIQISNP